MGKRDWKVPSPKEIGEKYQKTLDTEEPLSWWFHRPISRYGSWIYLHFSLWAEFIAFMTPVVDLIVIWLIMSGNWVWAAVFTQVHIIVDCMDGEVARVRAKNRKRTEQQGKWGSYVDSMAGTIMLPMVIFTAAYYLGSPLTGAIAMTAFFMVVLSSAYSHVYFQKARKKGVTQKIHKSIIGNLRPKPAFDSSTQKTLVTLTLLFQSLVFLWILIVGSVLMTFLRLWIYRK